MVINISLELKSINQCKIISRAIFMEHLERVRKEDFWLEIYKKRKSKSYIFEEGREAVVLGRTL